MKRIFTILAVFFVVGVFTSKAQSPSDSSYVRDLNYTFFNMSSLPNSITDSLANGSKILKDLREGKRGKGYAITVNFNTYLDIQLVSGAGGWDSYLFLLDANFQEVAHNDDWNGMGTSYGSHIISEVTAGQYYIIVSEYGRYTDNRPYTLTVDTISVTPLNQLTFTPVSLPFSIQDTFSTEDPTTIIYDTPCKAKGYSFQGTQGKFLMFDEDSTMGIDAGFLLDKDYNEIMLNSVMKFSYTGTYYLVLFSTNAPQPFSIKAEQIDDLPTIYVDGVNGDDSRNGLTAGTAIKTLDTAIYRTQGMGKYLLTDDYTFNNQKYLGVYYAEIYPYGKDINLKIEAKGHDIFRIYGNLVFGENGSDYYFIIDSNSNDGFYDFLDADYGGSILEVNNLKIRNSYMPSSIFLGDSIILRNCEFTNDTINDYFVSIEEEVYNSLKLINCNISQNLFYEGFIGQGEESLKVTFENTIVSGNTFNENYPVLFYYSAIINLTSGNWRNNNLSANLVYNGNPNLNSQNCAGIWALFNTTINIGSGFTMDVNNYICLDTSSVININKNLSASVVAQVYPYKYDESDNKFYSDYYEGRPMLTGSAVATNFQKFNVAQADNSFLWYLHSDGKLYTTVDPNGIAQTEVSEVRMYPNPAADRVTIDLQNTTANKIRMVDLYGRIVVEQDVDGQIEVIDLSNLANGMYFVQICNNGKVTATRKLMKN